VRLCSSCTEYRIRSLGRRVLDELDALADVTLQAIVAGLKKLLLLVVGAADNIDSLLGTVGLGCESVTVRIQSR
jgi:hypothetical protein